ncbi:hypothetical protein FACS189491_10530 [Spirochaetia bacterium]|nr:hypothetical protein FACS189491_10530 [Spirochaetia bacterium]
MFQKEYNVGNHNKAKIEFKCCDCGTVCSEVLERPEMNMDGESRTTRANPETTLVYCPKCNKCNKTYFVTVDADFGFNWDISINELPENLGVKVTGI